MKQTEEKMSATFNNSQEPPKKKIKIEPVDIDVKPFLHGVEKSKMPKRQIKKLIKKKKWLQNLPAKRAEEKLKLKKKKQEAREKNLKLGPSRKELKKSKMSESKCTVRVALDFSFDDLMSPRDIAKCINQLGRCYSLNRRSPDPMQFYVVNFRGLATQEIKKHNGYQNWDVFFRTESYLELFKKESLVYLTSDSKNVIQTIDEDKVYIIGALVDHNSQKGLCHRIAVENGINHGRLPIKEYLEMKSRKILPINHVFEILLNVCNGFSWKDAFLRVLPQRKGAKGKQSLEDTAMIDEKDKKQIANLVVEHPVEKIVKNEEIKPIVTKQEPTGDSEQSVQNTFNSDEKINSTTNVVIKQEPTSDCRQYDENILNNDEKIKPTTNVVIKQEPTSDCTQSDENILNNDEKIKPTANVVIKQEPTSDCRQFDENTFNNDEKIKPKTNVIIKQEPTSNCEQSDENIFNNYEKIEPIPDVEIKQEPTSDCEEET